MTIDDDPVILSSLAATLRAEFGIRPFTSGRLALDFLSRQRVNVIILDYQMPEMSGLEVLKELQTNEWTKDIPVLFLTSSIDSEREIEILEHGAVDYITKPVHPRVLLTRVRVHLELQRHRHHLEHLVAERSRSLQETLSELRHREGVTLHMLAKATDLRDHDTGGHIERTTEFVRVLVEDLLRAPPSQSYSLGAKEAQAIIRSAKLHDLGKIAIPDHILFKPGKLTAEEFEIMKHHTISGEQFFRGFSGGSQDSFLEIARLCAYSHHEKWDGSGYPTGTRGEDIPLCGRIIAIADVYDALRSYRPYKASLSHAESVVIMKENQGSHFDPHLVNIFLRHQQDFWDIYERIRDISPEDNQGLLQRTQLQNSLSNNNIP